MPFGRPTITSVFVIICVMLSSCDAPPQVETQGDGKRQEASTELERARTQESNNDQDVAIMKNMPEQTASIIKWLPGDTESVFVHQESFKLLSGDEFRGATLSTGLAAVPVQVLSLLPDVEAYQAIEGALCSTMVLAGRNFRRPDAPGLSFFEGAYILRFSSQLPKDLWTKLAAGSQPRSVHGVAVAEHRVTSGRNKLVLSIALLNENILIVATDRGYLNTMLANIKEEPKKPLISLDWPEWKHVDTQASIWAIRHFARYKNNRDPTSPFYEDRDAFDVVNRKPENFEWNVPDPDAIGFTFSFRKKKENDECVVYYLSKSSVAEHIVLLAWTLYPPLSTRPIVSKMGANVTKASFPDSDLDPDSDVDEESVYFLSLVKGRLGHASW